MKSESSVLKENLVSYDAKNQELFLTFKNGTQYLYRPVTRNLFNGFMSSESKGKFFNKHIKKAKAIDKFKVIPESF